MSIATVSKKHIKNIPWKIVFYTLLFGFICVINQRIHTASPLEGWREAFRDMTGLAIAALVLSHYSFKEFMQYKKFHIAWSVFGGIAGLILFFAFKSKMPFVHDWFVIVLDLFTWGYVLIQTVLTVFKQRRLPALHKGIVGLWAAMVLLMIVSRSDDLWPLAYAVMFLCFYYTDYSPEEKNQIFQGILNGIILSFFVFQAHSFLYRPYDQVRYVGWFTNPNNNVLYFCFVLAAVLVKLYMCMQKKTSKLWRVYYWLGIGTVFSFIILTIGRIGWITAFVLAFLFLIISKRDFRTSIIKRGLLILLCTSITFPLCFGAVRYIPPLRHHVYWFFGEWNEEKVHSWEPWNSEKFIDIDEFADAALGRITQSFSEIWQNSPFVIGADAADLEARKIPALSEEQGEDGLIVRKTIYEYFSKELNLRGHTSDEIGFQLLEEYWIGHAHNIYLQFGTQFGIPVMILFMILIVVSIRQCWVKLKRTHSAEAMGYFYFLLIPAVFGIFEYAWGAGSLTITLLFIAWRMAMEKEKEQKHEQNKRRRNICQ